MRPGTVIGVVALMAVTPSCADGGTASGPTTPAATTHVSGDPPAVATSTAPRDRDCRIDVHLHLDGLYRDGPTWATDFAAAAAGLVEAMDAASVDLAVVMPPPISADPDQVGTYTATELAEGTRSQPTRLSLAGGGGLLNPLIHDDTTATAVDPDLAAEIDQAFVSLLELSPAAVGELAAVHLSMTEGHPAEAISPDHPVLVEVARRSGAAGLPVDLHTEAVAGDAPLPAGLASPNPATLPDTVEGLGALLDAVPDTTIVWSHVGWDNTGDLTPELVGQLLDDHPNLVASLKQEGRSRGRNPLLVEGAWDPAWLTVLERHADRFVVGSDEFFGVPGQTPERPPSFEATWAAIDLLPDELARQVACDNPRRVYGIG